MWGVVTNWSPPGGGDNGTGTLKGHHRRDAGFQVKYGQQNGRRAGFSPSTNGRRLQSTGEDTEESKKKKNKTPFE